MKTKRIIIGLIIGFFLIQLLSSCAIDRKCPAYSKVSTASSHHNA